MMMIFFYTILFLHFLLDSMCIGYTHTIRYGMYHKITPTSVSCGHFTKIPVITPHSLRSNAYSNTIHRYNNMNSKFVLCQSFQVDATNTVQSNPIDNRFNVLKVVSGLLSLKIIDKFMFNSFKHYNIPFPSSLGGMIGMFTLFSFITCINNDIAQNLLTQFLPALSFIRIWLALFFIPPLVVLPLKL